MYLKRLVIFFAALSPFASGSVYAFGGEQCGPIFSSNYALNGRIEVRPSALYGPAAADFAKTILQVDSLLAPLQPATEARVFIDNVFAFSLFDARDFSISVGLRPSAMGNKHPAINQNILIHEYSHAVFEKNLMRDLESYKHLRQENLELLNKEDILHAEADALGEQASWATGTEQIRLKTLAEEKRAEAMFVTKRLQQLTSFWNLRSGLHELFADSVTLATTRDPRSISDLLKNAEQRSRDHSPEELLLRDFGDGRHHLNRAAWKKEQNLESKYATDVYYAFLPARWELWKLAKSRLKSDNYRKNLIPKVFEILERNLSEILTKKPDEIGPLGIKEIERVNQQIIEDFRREL